MALEGNLREAVDRIAAAGADLLGGGVIAASPLRELVRPFSKLAWVRFRLRQGETTLVLKTPHGESLTTPERLEKARRRQALDFELTATLRDRFHGDPALGVLRPVVHFPDLAVAATEEARGESLAELIRRRARWLPRRTSLGGLKEGCAGAGRWLRAFQTFFPADDQQVSLDDMVAYVDRRLERLERFGQSGLDARLRARVLALFELARGKLAASDLRGTRIHGDFVPGNVLIADGKVLVLDFAHVRQGSVEHDVTRFLHQLRLFANKPAYRPRTLAVLGEAFLSGYDPAHRRETPLLRLFMIQHLVCHWLGRLTIGKPGLAERLYNRRVIRSHRRDLEALLDGGDLSARGGRA